ncbi:MAG: ATP-binding protein [Pseudomonadota bacterium]|nr:ATP-binding protein [Pseudomonadota bacterium]
MTDGNWQRVAGRTQQRGFIDGTLPMLVKRAVVAQAVLILAALWSYATWRVYSDKAETLESARHELRAVAAGMYVHLQAVLNDSLGAARTAAQAIDANGGVMETPAATSAGLLGRELSSGEYVRALFVMTPNRFVAAIRNREVQMLDAPPPWLQAAIEETRSVYIGSTIEDPIESTQRAFPIAVRTVDSAGATVWAGALLGVDALDQLYETMAIPGGALSVTSTSGNLLLRVPMPALAHKGGQINVRNSDVYRGSIELSAAGGFIEAPSPFARGTWVYAIRRLGGYRMAVSASREKAAILQQWHDRTRGLTIVLVGISILFIGLTALLRHFINRLEKANTNLGQLNAELESRVAARTNELQEANQQLALTNEELEAFTASASHDLRSPLGTIAGQAGLLRDDLGAVMTDVITQRIDRIQSNVTRSSEIIDGLLSLARVSRQELLNERVDVSALTRNIIEDLRQQYPKHRVECVIEPGLIVNADPRLMKSLFGNLLGNAWKYTSRTANARVELNCTQATGGIVFSVRDNGAGFDMSRSQRLFEPFQRLHSIAEFPGVGIGLAIVARIVRRYGGKITADSEPGRGTIFRFTLPAAVVCAREIPATN